MSDISNFFLTVTDSIIRIESIELMHPDFDKPFLFQKNYIDETINLSGRDFSYALFEITRGASSADLEQEFNITFADYDDELKNAIEKADNQTAISFISRNYRDDDLSEPMRTFETLYIKTVSSDSDGTVSLVANAEPLNSVKTGLIYTFDAFPLMKGAV